ncbi:MAG: caspase family protein [Cyanobacteria bacterium HKST-UBA02]|nr:caspase family protein [Cyanobacteria bacterium HKST-UBA02]
MKFPKKALSLCLSLVFATSLTAPSLAKGSDETPATKKPFFAVLVGIDDYISPNVNDLSGCKNDVDDMKAVLVKNYNLPDDDEHILVLKDREATKEGIKNAFRKMLVSNAEKYGDKGLYLFHYSGHGSYCKDTNGDEAGDDDQTLVTVDSRQGDVYDLVDDELDILLDELTAKTKNSVLVFDCCHSYTNTRGGKVTPRKVEPDSRPQPEQKPVTRSSGERSTRAATEKTAMAPRDQKYVVFSGCLQDETSGETRDPQGRTNGLLTRYLVEALAKSGSDTTYRQLWDTVAKGVTSENWAQHPQVEGDLERPILNASATRLEPGIKVLKAEDEKAVIDAGEAHRIVEKGALVAFYKAWAKKLEGEKDILAKGLVEEVGTLKSSVKLDRKVDPEELAKAKARIVTPFGGDRPLKVKVEIKEASSRGNLFQLLDKEASQETPGSASEGSSAKPKTGLLEITKTSDDPLKSNDDWDVAVVQDKFETFADSRRNVGSRAPKADPEKPVFFIAAQNGMPLFDLWLNTSDPEAPKVIYSALKKRARQRLVQTLENKVSPLDGKLKIEFVRVTGWDTDINGKPKAPKTETKEADQIGTPVVKESEQFLLKLTNTSDTPLYPTVVSLGTSGKIEIIYPPSSTHAVPLQPGDSMKTDVMQAGAPVGPESFKVIATTSHTDFHFLEQEGITRSGTTRKAVSNPLEKLMEDRHNATRDSSRVTVPSLDDWATADLDIVIATPE